MVRPGGSLYTASATVAWLRGLLLPFWEGWEIKPWHWDHFLLVISSECKGRPRTHLRSCASWHLQHGSSPASPFLCHLTKSDTFLLIYTYFLSLNTQTAQGGQSPLIPCPLTHPVWEGPVIGVWLHPGFCWLLGKGTLCDANPQSSWIRDHVTLELLPPTSMSDRSVF